MGLPSLPEWSWIVIVVAAAFTQTIRNTAQRKLTGTVGTLPATWVRFLYGLPFAAAAVIVLQLVGERDGPAHAWTLPVIHLPFLVWLTIGAVGQLLATAFMLASMRERNFVIGVAYSKTDVLQVALFGALFLGEIPGWAAGLGMLIATAGVILVSWPRKGPDPHVGTTAAAQEGGSGCRRPVRAFLIGPAAIWGLASGAGFAFSAVGYRGAALALQAHNPDLSPWAIGAWGVLLAQCLQSALLGAWIAWRQRAALAAVARAWRLSLLAGAMGALASLGWFTAFAMRAAADVRAIGLVEVVFSVLVSSRLLRESLSFTEFIGLALVGVGLFTLLILG